MPGHWRHVLLNDFAPDANRAYVANMSQRPAALPTLPPFASQYLDLVELGVTGALIPLASGACSPDRPLKLPRGRKVGEIVGMCEPLNTHAMSHHQRLIGRDWPAFGTTMVGHARLHNVRHAIEHAVASGVEGDFAELGVWRGGVATYARAVLNALLQSLG